MKNILLMVPMLHQGGFERICAMTAGLLQDKHSDSCNVTVVIFSDEDRIYDLGGAELINLRLGARPGKLAKLINVFKRVHAVKKIKKEKQIALSYSFGISANLVNALSKGQDTVWLGIRAYGDLASGRYMKLFAKKGDAMVCCAKVMEEDIKKRYRPKRTFTLYNPCDVTGIKKMAAEAVPPEYEDFFAGGQVVMGMGREDDVKGFWHLIKAFFLVKKECPDARLMIVGEGEFTEYRRLAENLKLGADCAFPGLQKNPFSYLARASVFVMTSISEGFPNALAEAMAAGVPALSVNCKSGPAEILSADFKEVPDCHRVYHAEYGVLLPVINPVKNMEADVIEKEERVMAAEIIKLLKNKALWEEKSRAGLARSEAFSVEQYEKTLLREMGLDGGVPLFDGSDNM